MLDIINHSLINNLGQNNLTQEVEKQNFNQNLIDKEQTAIISAENNRYQDQLMISNKIVPENKECDCGECDRCLGKEGLSESEKAEIKRLEARDREVRTHEQAHVNAGASSPHYEYEVGPDGKRYITGGHAEIETSKAATPKQTIEKAQKIKRAALAPANPSAQDRKVAAEAENMLREAELELQKENNKKTTPEGSQKSSINEQIKGMFSQKNPNQELGNLLQIFG